MMMKKSFGRKWVVIAVAAYLLIIMELLPSPTIASSLPAQQLPEAATGDTSDHDSFSSLSCFPCIDNEDRIVSPA